MTGIEDDTQQYFYVEILHESNIRKNASQRINRSVAIMESSRIDLQESHFNY